MLVRWKWKRRWDAVIHRRVAVDWRWVALYNLMSVLQSISTHVRMGYSVLVHGSDIGKYLFLWWICNLVLVVNLRHETLL